MSFDIEEEEPESKITLKLMIEGKGKNEQSPKIWRVKLLEDGCCSRCFVNGTKLEIMVRYSLDSKVISPTIMRHHSLPGAAFIKLKHHLSWSQ